MTQSHLGIEKLKISPAQTLLFYLAHYDFELNFKLNFYLYTSCIDCIVLMCPTMTVLNENIEVLLCQYFRTNRYLLTETNNFPSLKLRG